MATKKKQSQKTKSPRRSTKTSQPSSTLKIAITLPRPADNLGPCRFDGRLTTHAVMDFVPDDLTRQRALAKLQELGFTLMASGRLTASVRGSRSLFEKVFGTRLSQFDVQPLTGSAPVNSFYFPEPGAPWQPREDLEPLLDDAYIQWPHIYMNQLFSSTVPSPVPPQVDYHHLRVPGDLVSLLNVAKVHRQGTTGRGVRVAMIDSGFNHSHAYFERMGYNTSVVLAPGATDSALDGNGHGTGESANLLAVAPDVHFIGVKLDNESNPAAGASLLEGFQEAIAHNPDIISVSLGFDLVNRNSPNRQHLIALPNSLVALEAEIEAAVASGTTVVFSAGNGHVTFPGMMPDVISAGGTYVGEDGSLQASDYASGFVSSIYPGRNVPDFCGLVGLAANNADYIMLPLQSGCEIDQNNAAHDGTASTDGWGVFSGTSASAPQLAGICALLKQKNPNLTPNEIKQVLRLTSLDVINGKANAASSEGAAVAAGPGPDSATGSGFVDAFAAWQQV